MTTITGQLADALRAMRNFYAEGINDEQEARINDIATKTLAAYDAQRAPSWTKCGDTNCECSNSDHTPEPWMVEQGTLTISAPNFKGPHRPRVPVCYPQDTMNRESNARRIVACVNACAGIPTETLETSELGNGTIRKDA